MGTEIINSIDKLNPVMAVFAEVFLKIAKERGLKVKVFETLRPVERQEWLWAQGRTRAGNIVTNTKSGSMHQYGLAMDVVFDDKEPWGNHHPWQALGQVGRDIGLYWGGDWKNFKDSPHFQLIPPEWQDKARAGNLNCQIPWVKLQEGDQGFNVVILQKAMTLKVDGIFGPQTKAEVIIHQKAKGLTPDGIAWWGVYRRMIGLIIKYLHY